MARSSYAYGVDLRRAQWFANSSLSQTAMRAIELQWYQLVETLTGDELAYPDKPELTPILRELAGIASLLHMRTPGVRVLTARARAHGEWGLVTPLGNTRCSDDWLILDLEGLRSLPSAERAFLLAAGLAHLQCAHGPIFVTHFVGHKKGRGRLLRRIMTPWSRLSDFSADRAGLLAAGALEPALMALGTSVAARPPWFPGTASLQLRRQAIEDFENSRVMARIRTRLHVAREQIGLPPVQLEAPAERTQDTNDNGPAVIEHGVPESAWSLARCDERLTRRLRLL
jgi:hypothetical protein